MQILLRHYASQDLNTVNLLRTDIVWFWNIFWILFRTTYSRTYCIESSSFSKISMLRLYDFQERSVCCQYNSWSSIVIFSHEKDEWLCCYFDYYVISMYSFLKCAKSFSGWKLLHVLPQRDLNPFKIYRVTTNEWQQWCQCMACTTSTKNSVLDILQKKWYSCTTSRIFQNSFARFKTSALTSSILT